MQNDKLMKLQIIVSIHDSQQPISNIDWHVNLSKKAIFTSFAEGENKAQLQIFSWQTVMK